MRIGRADQLATSHRYMISWIKTMEASITEQQRIVVKRGNVDPRKDRLSFLLIQMPSDKMAALCIMHLMKHLFAQFLEEYKYDPEELALVTKDEKDLLLRRQSIKIPSVQLFQQLGQLFDKELRQLQAKRGGADSKARM